MATRKTTSPVTHGVRCECGRDHSVTVPAGTEAGSYLMGIKCRCGKQINFNITVT